MRFLRVLGRNVLSWGKSIPLFRYHAIIGLNKNLANLRIGQKIFNRIDHRIQKGIELPAVGGFYLLVAQLPDERFPAFNMMCCQLSDQGIETNNFMGLSPRL